MASTESKTLWGIHDSINDHFSELESLIAMLNVASMSDSKIPDETLNYYMNLVEQQANKVREDIQKLQNLVEMSK